MDGSNAEHSDSDSGDSWTLLEPSPCYAAEAPQFPENCAKLDAEIAEQTDRDEDTDGISIISDSDVESPITESTEALETSLDIQNPRPTEEVIPQFVLNPPLTCPQPANVPIRNENFLGESTGKLRTYVHRRNKRLSTVLNIIVLGSIITAAGVAIGHMWGVRDECIVQTTPSVNKILSNLYKLQEENSYLRSKLKELTLATQRKDLSKVPRHAKCRKLFEESLNKQNVEKLTKCVDFDHEKILANHLTVPDFEKEFVTDLDKLKMVYQQNKSWLDDEVAKRQKIEKASVNKFKNYLKLRNAIMEDIEIPVTDASLKGSLDEIQKLGTVNFLSPIPEKGDEVVKKVSYADSVKMNEVGKKYKRDTNEVKQAELPKKKKDKKHIDAFSVRSVSEEDIVKDNRYVRPKPIALEKKRHDRQKIHKKQKRRNKFEQWEMKGGYKNDYDDISLLSSQDHDTISKTKPVVQGVHLQDYLDPLSDTSSPNNEKIKNEKKQNKEKLKEKEKEWFEMRMTQRSEARKKLEKELFGDNVINAGWYFRRMKRREQCRVKGDNATYRKLSKRNMNFKTKH